MKKILFIIIGLFILSPIFSQEEPQKITIRKESNLAKASYDNVDYKLIAQDKYGNIVNHVVKSFELHYRISNKKIKMMISYSESLTPEMLEEFKKLKEAKKIFFTKIMAEDEFGNVVRLPDVIEVQFPDCKIKKDLKKQ
ncbi:MAG: hypothetical protein IPG89_03675 [Bacteroidetes bacterium]|nr:hypothetical protein [Bacteroidota bacterium]